MAGASFPAHDTCTAVTGSHADRVGLNEAILKSELFRMSATDRSLRQCGRVWQLKSSAQSQRDEPKILKTCAFVSMHLTQAEAAAARDHSQGPRKGTPQKTSNPGRWAQAPRKRCAGAPFLRNSRVPEPRTRTLSNYGKQQNTRQANAPRSRAARSTTASQLSQARQPVCCPKKVF